MITRCPETEVLSENRQSLVLTFAQCGILSNISIFRRWNRALVLTDVVCTAVHRWSLWPQWGLNADQGNSRQIWRIYRDRVIWMHITLLDYPHIQNQKKNKRNKTWTISIILIVSWMHSVFKRHIRAHTDPDHMHAWFRYPPIIQVGISDLDPRGGS